MPFIHHTREKKDGKRVIEADGHHKDEERKKPLAVNFQLIPKEGSL